MNNMENDQIKPVEVQEESKRRKLKINWRGIGAVGLAVVAAAGIVWGILAVSKARAESNEPTTPAILEEVPEVEVTEPVVEDIETVEPETEVTEPVVEEVEPEVEVVPETKPVEKPTTPTPKPTEPEVEEDVEQPSETPSEPETDDTESAIDPSAREMLALVIYQEAGGDAHCDECRRRVADVVLNRVNDSRFPNTMYGVLTAPYQYGRLHWTGLVWPSRANNAGEKHAVERAYRIADEVLNGQHSELYGQGYVWQAEFTQGSSGFWHCGHFFGK